MSLLGKLVFSGCLAGSLMTATADEPQNSRLPNHSQLRVLAPIVPGERPFSQIDRDIDAFLRREARADSEGDRMNAIEDLCLIFEELKRDPRLGISETLQGYKAKVYSKLLSIRREMERVTEREHERVARENRRHATQAASANRSLPDTPAPDPSTDGNLSDAEIGASQAFVGQFSYFSAGSGGGSSLLITSGGHYGGGAIADNANNLIELIQRTVQPEFWDVNGGPGSIAFYAPLNALVVRATSEVHSSLGTTLDELRRVGGR